MGFVTESQMRTDYKLLFQESIGDTQYNLVVWLTPDGILIEVVKETMDSQSVNEEVILSKIIDKKISSKGGIMKLYELTDKGRELLKESKKETNLHLELVNDLNDLMIHFLPVPKDKEK